jgi:hypothetical protein
MRFFDALNDLYRLKHQEAVWEDLVGFLLKHVDNDVQSADFEFKSEDAGVVPQDIIEDIIKVIQKEKLTPLEEAIARYTEMEVGNGKEEGQQRSKASVTGKKKPAVRRKQRPAAGGGSASDQQPQQGD